MRSSARTGPGSRSAESRRPTRLAVEGNLGGEACPTSGNTVDVQPPAKSLDSIGQPAQPRSAASIGTANAIVSDFYIEPAVTRRDPNSDA